MKVTGVDKLVARLNKRPNVQNVIQSNTNLLLAKASTKAPVDTGNLRRSITAQTTSTKGVITSQANYSGYVEYGTRFMSAQPYMKPAFNEVLPKFKNDIKRELNK